MSKPRVESTSPIIDVAGEPATRVYSNTDREMLEQIRTAARAGVLDEVRQNALPLAAFCVAAGAVGGALFRGRGGLLVALALTGFGTYQMISFKRS